MRELVLSKTAPTFPHWLRQRYIQIIMFTSLLMVDVVVTYLYLVVYQTAYEQNPFMKPLLETPYGFAILTLLKLVVVLIMAGASYFAYRQLHSDKHSEKAKKQTYKLEVVLWYFVFILSGVLDILLLINVN